MADRFDEITNRAGDLEEFYGARNSLFTKMEDIYLLKNDADIPSQDWIKQTLSPDGRNSILGGVRLMSAAEPRFSVPVGKNRAANKARASKLEREASYIWQAACNVAGYPLHADIALASLLYGEAQLTITSTHEMVKATTGADKKRWERVARTSPVLIDVINPAMGFPEFDALGMRSYYSKRTMTVGELRGRWGMDQKPESKSTDDVVVCDWWDLEDHYVWVEGDKAPILGEAHGLDYIPVVAVISEGSRMFRTADYTRQPLLYTLYKSGLLSRQNLSLTLMFSLAFAMGANPMYVWRRRDPNKEAPEQDYSHIGGLVILDDGEDYASLAKQVIDPSLMQMWQLAQEKGIESTFYRQAFGESLGSGEAFSTVALLSQAGRLPLIMYQKMTSFAIAQAMQIAFRILKDGKQVNVRGDKGEMAIVPDDIPDDLILTANVEISQPQDQRQNVAIAAQATGGEQPLVSKRYALEEIVGVEQPDQMMQEIMEEQFVNMKFQLALQSYAQQAQAQAQQQAQGGMPGQPGQPGQMPPGMDQQQMLQQQMMQQQGGQPMPPGMEQGGLPPELMAQLQQTGAQQGLPGIGAAAPMMPGEQGLQEV